MTALIFLMCAGRAVNTIVQNKNYPRLPVLGDSSASCRLCGLWHFGIGQLCFSFVGWIHDEGWW
jgi:hypothetical protein